MSIGTILAVLILGGADPSREELYAAGLRDFVTRGREIIDRGVRRAEEKLAAAKAEAKESRSRSKFTPGQKAPTAAERQSRQRAADVAVKDAERAIEIARDAPFVQPGFPQRKWEIGDVGSLVVDTGMGIYDESLAKCVQVLGPKEMLVEIKFPGVRVVSGSLMVIESAGTFVSRGVPTHNVATGGQVQLPKTVRVTGNHTYETVDGGSKTVFVLEGVPENELKAAIATP